MTANDPQAEPMPLYEALNARQIAKTLLLRESDKEYVLEELLLWPPDLFCLHESDLQHYRRLPHGGFAAPRRRISPGKVAADRKLD